MPPPPESGAPDLLIRGAGLHASEPLVGTPARVVGADVGAHDAGLRAEAGRTPLGPGAGDGAGGRAESGRGGSARARRRDPATPPPSGTPSPRIVSAPGSVTCPVNPAAAFVPSFVIATDFAASTADSARLDASPAPNTSASGPRPIDSPVIAGRRKLLAS